MKVDEHTLCSSKTDFTIKFSIPKLCENIILHNSNVTHVGRKYYEVTLTSMENQGKSLINTENMKVDDHRHQKQIAPLNFPHQNCVKTLLSIILMSLMLVEIIIK